MKELIESEKSTEEIINQLTENSLVSPGPKDVVKTKSGSEHVVTKQYMSTGEELETEDGSIDPKEVVAVKRTAFGSSAPWIDVSYDGNGFKSK